MHYKRISNEPGLREQIINHRHGITRYNLLYRSAIKIQSCLRVFMAQRRFAKYLINEEMTISRLLLIIKYLPESIIWADSRLPQFWVRTADELSTTAVTERLNRVLLSSYGNIEKIGKEKLTYFTQGCWYHEYRSYQANISLSEQNSRVLPPFYIPTIRKTLEMIACDESTSNRLNLLKLLLHFNSSSLLYAQLISSKRFDGFFLESDKLFVPDSTKIYDCIKNILKSLCREEMSESLLSVIVKSRTCTYAYLTNLESSDNNLDIFVNTALNEEESSAMFLSTIHDVIREIVIDVTSQGEKKLQGISIFMKRGYAIERLLCMPRLLNKLFKVQPHQACMGTRNLYIERILQFVNIWLISSTLRADSSVYEIVLELIRHIKESSANDGDVDNLIRNFYANIRVSPLLDVIRDRFNSSHSISGLSDDLSTMFISISRPISHIYEPAKLIDLKKSQYERHVNYANLPSTPFDKIVEDLYVMSVMPSETKIIVNPTALDLIEVGENKHKDSRIIYSWWDSSYNSTLIESIMNCSWIYDIIEGQARSILSDIEVIPFSNLFNSSPGNFSTAEFLFLKIYMGILDKSISLLADEILFKNCTRDEINDSMNHTTRAMRVCDAIQILKGLRTLYIIICYRVSTDTRSCALASNPNSSIQGFLLSDLRKCVSTLHQRLSRYCENVNLSCECCRDCSDFTKTFYITDDLIISTMQLVDNTTSRVIPQEIIVAIYTHIVFNFPFLIEFPRRVSYLQRMIDNYKIITRADLHFERPTLIVRRHRELQDSLEHIRNYLESRNVQLSYVSPNMEDDSYVNEQANRASVTSNLSRFVIRYVDEYGINEPGVDGGGLTKEYITNVSEQYRIKFLTPVLHNSTLIPTHTCDNDVYILLGLILGKSVFDGITLSNYKLNNIFINSMLGIPCTVDDIQYYDPDISRSIRYLMHSCEDIENLHLTFTYTDTHRIEYPLCADGNNKSVSRENVHEYCLLLVKAISEQRFRRPAYYVMSGIDSVFPSSWLNLFNPSEIQTLFSGSDNNSITEIIDDLESNTIYTAPYDGEHEIIRGFWEAVRSFNKYELKKFLRFTMGIENIPLLGFRSLRPNFAIASSSANGLDSLPTASTCTNLLKIPPYESVEIMRQKLLLAIMECSNFELS